MGEADQGPKEPQVVHKHYHIWPKSQYDCGCFLLLAIISVCAMIETLARLGALPWQK